MSPLPMPRLSPASAQAFRTVLTEGPISRAQISSRTGLSPGGVTRAMQPLIGAGYVVEHASAAIGVGRPAGSLEVRADQEFFVGVKVTADEVIAAVCDLRATVREVSHGALDGTSVDEVVATIARTVGDVLSTSPDVAARTHVLGLSLSGDVEHHTGMVRYSPFLGWHQVPIADLVRAATGLATIVENDVRALTVAESWFGAGAGQASFALVTVGAGIGCGLFVNGGVVSGSHGVAGEIGHLTAEPDGPRCHCGNRGCVEAIASESAILALLDKSGRPGLDIREAVTQGHRGDPETRAVFARAGRAIGLALAAIANLVGPGLIVISGEGLDAFDLLESDLRATFAEHAFSTAAQCELLVRPHSFDDWARGAAVVALRHRFSAARP